MPEVTQEQFNRAITLAGVERDQAKYTDFNRRARYERIEAICIDLVAKEKAAGLPTDYTVLNQLERREARLKYIEIQDNKCFYCHKSLDWNPPQEILAKEINWHLFPGGRNFLNHPIHLQHNHDTGMTEGAVHAYCNAVLWQYEGR